MKKKLKLNQELKDFDGKPLKDEKNKTWKLKNVLMAYIRLAQNMGLNDREMSEAYSLGFILGKENKEIILTSSQYDMLKKLCDNGKAKNANGQENFIFGLILRKQAKNMIDEAETVKEVG